MCCIVRRQDDTAAQGCTVILSGAVNVYTYYHGLEYHITRYGWKLELGALQEGYGFAIKPQNTF
jgi:hypothetical protein